MQRGGTRQHGFTVVEVLVVVVVIAILASIVVVAYRQVRGASYDAAIMADLRDVSTKIKAFASDNNTAPRVDIGNGINDLSDLNWEANKGSYDTNGSTVTRNLIYCYSDPASPNNRYWAVISLSKSGKIFYATQAVAPKEYTAATKPSFSEAAPGACDTLTAQATSQAYGASYAGWYSLDTSTGPWRSWAGG